MSSGQIADQRSSVRRVRSVIEGLVRDGGAVACSDGTVHSLFPVAVSAAESEALWEWVSREGSCSSMTIICPRSSAQRRSI